MNFALWSTVAGLLFLCMALSSSILRRIPLSSSIVYLVVGIATSPLWLNIEHAKILDHALLLEHLTEFVILVSLFTSGLKLSAPVGDWRWTLPARLATTSMIITVALITLVGVTLLKLPLGVAVLLGGMLAPTDPVLASEVQVDDPADRDRLRFALTGEGGLNDGTAFPVVILGLGLLGNGDLGAFGWKWLAVDVVWASAAGLALGGLMGSAIGALVLYLRKKHKEAIGLDNFIALGLIALTYGVALEISAYGFLAVFAAGFALRRVERRHSERAAASEKSSPRAENKDEPSSAEAIISPTRETVEAVATHETKAGAFMAQAVLSFNEQIERIGEVAAVVAIGMMLWAVDWRAATWWFPLLLLLVIRPVAVAVGLYKSKSSRLQRRLIGWFGIRGIGSLYYLTYAMNHGLPSEWTSSLEALTLSVVITSIVVHGISVTPLMAIYSRRRRPAASAAEGDTTQTSELS